MLRIFLVLLFFLPFQVFSNVIQEEQFGAIQPPTRPMVVDTGFYLLNLVSLNERDETFLADIYLIFAWNDPRLAFEGDPKYPHIFSENAAKDKLETIWSPNPEFLNTGQRKITNQTLYIYPDGKVEYSLGLTAEFRGSFDYRKFPFDSQKLEIKVSSFVWDNDWLNFTVDPKKIGFAKSEKAAFEERNVQQVSAKILEESQGYEHDIYSNYLVTISIQRNPSFYLYQVIFPCLIVLIAAYCVFFINPKEFANRLIVGLTCLLVFVAIKFAINLELPRINYITLIDKIFFLFYACAGITIAVSLVERILMDRPHASAISIDKKARIFVPVLFLIAFLIFVLT